MKFFFDKYEFTSGGALGSLTLGLVVKELWRRRLPGLLASQVSWRHVTSRTHTMALPLQCAGPLAVCGDRQPAFGSQPLLLYNLRCMEADMMLAAI